MSLTISVITPSYNQGEFIDRTIQSVLNQRILPLEYLIFDAMSQDNTVDILKQYEKKLPSSLFRWVSEKDAGQADAVNKGLKMARGDIIAWLNSDDIYYPDAFQTVIDFFEKNPAVDVLYGEANHIDKKDQLIEKYPTEPWNQERLYETCFLSQPAVFFRKTVIERYGLLNEQLQYCMDYEYWLRLGKNGACFVYIPILLAGTRLYEETKTLGQRKMACAEINQMFCGHAGYAPDLWISHYAHVVAASKGLSLEKTRKHFLWTLITIAIYTSLNWNRKISRKLMKMLFEWSKDLLMTCLEFFRIYRI